MDFREMAKRVEEINQLNRQYLECRFNTLLKALSTAILLELICIVLLVIGIGIGGGI